MILSPSNHARVSAICRSGLGVLLAILTACISETGRNYPVDRDPPDNRAADLSVSMDSMLDSMMEASDAAALDMGRLLDGAEHDVLPQADAGVELRDAEAPDLAVPDVWCEVETPSENEVIGSDPVVVRVGGFVNGAPVQVCRARVVWRGADPSDIREERQMCGFDSGIDGVIVVHFYDPSPGLVALDVEMLVTLDAPFEPDGYLRFCERSFFVE